MTEQDFAEMLSRGQTRVRVTRGYFEGRVGTVTGFRWRDQDAIVNIRIDPSGSQGEVTPEFLVETIEPEEIPKAFAPVGTVYSTLHGIATWQQQDRENRRIHVELTGDSLMVWPVVLRPLTERYARFDKHLPADRVPAVLDGMMMDRDHSPKALDGLDLLMQEVG